MSCLVLLISDDDSTDRELRIALTKATPECRLGSAANRAGVLAHPAPTVILLDLMLADEPPFDVLRWLRAERRYKDIPVFVLGSEVIHHEVNEAYALGANACLVKESAPAGLESIAQALATYASLLRDAACAA